MTMNIAVAFASDTSRSPNIRVQSNARSEVYWKCIVVCLMSAKMFGGDGVEPKVFSDGRVPEGYGKYLETHGVTHIETRFTFKPPEGFGGAFIGAFYMFDAIRWFAKTAASDDAIMIVDPDCIVNASLEKVGAFLRHAPYCVYSLRAPESYTGNGQSLRNIGAWRRKNMPALNTAGLRWIGGEFLALTGAGCRGVMPLIEEIWDANLCAFHRGDDYLKTEEHILSLLFADPSLARRDIGGEIIYRAWTARSHYNTTSLAQELPIWHLPAEKERGFADIFELIRGVAPEEAKALLSDRALLAQRLGFEGRRTEKMLCELWTSLRRLKSLALGGAVDFGGHS
jgi:hypothetical protein